MEQKKTPFVYLLQSNEWYVAKSKSFGGDDGFGYCDDCSYDFPCDVRDDNAVEVEVRVEHGRLLEALVQSF